VIAGGVAAGIAAAGAIGGAAISANASNNAADQQAEATRLMLEAERQKEADKKARYDASMEAYRAQWNAVDENNRTNTERKESQRAALLRALGVDFGASGGSVPRNPSGQGVNIPPWASSEGRSTSLGALAGMGPAAGMTQPTGVTPTGTNPSLDPRTGLPAAATLSDLWRGW
jgi:hypothetical protein